MPPETVAAIEAAIGAAGRVLAITHVAPDGDAIGSLTGLGLALRRLGKRVTLACDDPAPATVSFLPAAGDIRQPGSFPTTGYDLIFALDCGDEERMGRSFADLRQPRPPVINIDHHVTNTCFGDIDLVAPETTSTAELLTELFARLNLPLDPAIATCLLTGIVTDTLGFRIVSVTPRTIRLTGDLMEAGANLAEITMQALNLKPLATLRLYERGLRHLRFEDGLLWTAISFAEQQAAGLASASSSGLVSLLGNTLEAAMGVVLLEQADGQINVSFRCRPPWDVAGLATGLGGGGHRLASGCTLPGPLAEAERLVVERSLAELARQRLAEPPGLDGTPRR